jgi:hypothetical protein
MDIEVSPTKKVTILGLDKRSRENIAWCAASYGASRLYWINGYILCLEVYEKSFEEEMKKKEFPISQVCYVKFPKYEKLYEIDKSFQIPVVDVSDMKLFQNILNAILEYESTNAASADCEGS